MAAYFSRDWEPGAFVVSQDLGELVNQLTPGSRLAARIVLCLDRNQYLIRIKGRNLVMTSSETFQRFDEIELEVRAVRPHLVLRPVSGSARPGGGSAAARDGFDVIV